MRAKFFILPVVFVSFLALFALGCGNEEMKSGPTPYDSIKADNPVDSLFQVLEIAGQDTFRVNGLAYLSWLLRRNNPDTAIILGEQAVMLAEQLQYDKGAARAHSNLAVPYRLTGDYKKAIEHNQIALEIAIQMNDTNQMATSTGALGTIHYMQGNYPRALEYYLSALTMAEAIGDSGSIATQLSNIGALFIVQDQPDSAVRYYAKALMIDKARRDTTGISFDLSGIGSAYGKAESGDTALIYFLQAYALEKSFGTTYGQAKVLGNIGVSWAMLAEKEIDPRRKREFFDSAMVNYTRAIDLAQEVNDRRSVAINASNQARVYITLHQYDEAEQLLLYALSLTDSLGILENQKDVESNLAMLYDSLGMTEKAYAHYQQYILLRDSLVNDDKSNAMTRAQMNFEFEKERAVQQAKTDEELARQQLMLNVSIAGGLMLLIVAGVSIRAYRTKKRSGEIISQQKQEVENQKILVEAKQKEIIDSITYAKRIQSAILPGTGEIERQFPDAFVLFNPKDIVSGDFYWMAKTKDYTFVAAADCTGHGVPGGFMSMLGHSLLNEVVLEKQISDTGEILDLLRIKIIHALKQTGESGENKDGMDLVLCRFNNDFSNLIFSCANNPLWICRNNQMMEFKADKQPVGISGSATPLQFRTQELKLEKGDCIYMFTDGYADQFGGPKGKKFKYKSLQESLLKSHHLPMAEQRKMMSSIFEEWKGDLAQIDDVLLIGIRAQ